MKKDLHSQFSLELRSNYGKVNAEDFLNFAVSRIVPTELKRLPARGLLTEARVKSRSPVWVEFKFAKPSTVSGNVTSSAFS